jgi:hypothetical protein
MKGIENEMDKGSGMERTIPRLINPGVWARLTFEKKE